MGRIVLERNVGLPFTDPEREMISGISVVMPAFNEEDAVESQVGAVRLALDAAGISHEIIVIDDCSSDGTGAAVLRSGARLISIQKTKVMVLRLKREFWQPGMKLS